jgi:hypothetical protein
MQAVVRLSVHDSHACMLPSNLILIFPLLCPAGSGAHVTCAWRGTPSGTGWQTLIPASHHDDSHKRNHHTLEARLLGAPRVLTKYQVLRSSCECFRSDARGLDLTGLYHEGSSGDLAARARTTKLLRRVWMKQSAQHDVHARNVCLRDFVHL